MGQLSPNPLSANALTCAGYHGNTLSQAGCGFSCLRLQGLEGSCEHATQGGLGWVQMAPERRLGALLVPNIKKSTPTLASTQGCPQGKAAPVRWENSA